MLDDLERLTRQHEVVVGKYAAMAEVASFITYQVEHHRFIIKESDYLLMSPQAQEFLNSVRKG